MLRMETSTLFQRRIALVWNVLQPETLLYLGRTRLFLVVALVLCYECPLDNIYME